MSRISLYQALICGGDGAEAEAGPLAADGRVFHTLPQQVGSFACSDPLLTRLAQNIHASQRGNMMGNSHRLTAARRACGMDGRCPFFMPHGRLQL